MSTDEKPSNPTTKWSEAFLLEQVDEYTTRVLVSDEFRHDLFAAAALAGMEANETRDFHDVDQAAFAHAQADAMLMTEREKERG